jgi:hypothetical protein
MQNIPAVIGAVLAYGVIKIALGLRRNIAIAKASNLPYLVVRKSCRPLDTADPMPVAPNCRKCLDLTFWADVARSDV